MSLAWTTIAVLVLLLPGFLFFIGLYFPERLSREAAPGSPLGQLAGIVFIASLVHGLFYALVGNACGSTLPCIRVDYMFALLQLEHAKNIPLGDIVTNLNQYRWWIFLYLFSSSLAGIGLGALFGWMILRGPLRGFAQHSWMYDLIDEKRDHYTLAYVLTHIRSDERMLMYRGFLREFYLTSEGKIAYLVLTNCSRYYLLFKEKQVLTSNPKDWVVLGTNSDEKDTVSSRRQWSYLVIKGEDIANVVFDRYLLGLEEDNLFNLPQETKTS